jgi:hypothetical protein
MSRHHSNRRKTAAAPLAIVLLSLLLAACGGGSGSTSSSSASASTKTGTNARGQFAARGAALRTCLKKEGITLPERKPGKTGGKPPAGPFGAGGSGGQRGGFQLPKGVTREKLQAALKKCGGGFGGGGARRFGGARSAQRLTKFAACMRSNGINLPTPNTSGKGPVFDTKGIDTTSAAFKQADAKCAKELRPAGGAAGGPGAAPGASGEAGAPGGGVPGASAPGGAPAGGESGAPPA